MTGPRVLSKVCEVEGEEIYENCKAAFHHSAITLTSIYNRCLDETLLLHITALYIHEETFIYSSDTFALPTEQIKPLLKQPFHNSVTDLFQICSPLFL